MEIWLIVQKLDHQPVEFTSLQKNLSYSIFTTGLTIANMNKQTILCVDDEVDNVDALERLFRKQFHVLKATSAKEGLSLLDQYPEEIALIISDQRMPEMTGVEMLEQAQKKYPETIRILLTGYTDVESIIMAVNQGQIYRYLTKPWDPVDLLNTVEKAVEKFNLRKELAQKNLELNAALEELKSLDTAKSNFMILINHELKTPLTSILSFGELLQETHLNDEQSLYVNRVIKSADRLKQIVEDVLVIVKSETGQLKIQKQRMQFQMSESQLPIYIRNLMSKKLLRLHTHWVSKEIETSLELLQQVLFRIIHNAVKFSSEAGKVSVETKDINSGVEFSVTNQGAQIQEATLKKILRPFYLDENVMNHSTGMGLGLTICQSILKTMGSGLHFENLADGVRVSFIIPTTTEAHPN